MWRQILGYVPVNVANIVVSFGTIVILTRILSAAEFGRYALAITVLHFSHMTFFSWIEAAMARYHARAEANGYLPTHIKTTYVTSGVLVLIIVPLLLGCLYISGLEGRMKLLLAFAVLVTGVNLLYNLGIEAHKAAHRILRFSAVHTSQSLLGFAVGIMIIMVTPLRELGFFIGLLLAAIIALAVDFSFMRRQMKGGKTDKALVSKYFAYGMPICLALMLSYLLAQGDLFFIKYFMGDAAVGEYNAGYNLANRSLDVLFIWLGMAVTPIAVTTLERAGVEKTVEILKQYGEMLLLIVMPAAVGIGLVAEPAGFILGQSVRDNAVMIMPWIAIAGVMNGFIAYYIQRAFILAGRTGAMALTMILPVVLNFGLNIYLIPLYGLYGAVWATLGAYGFAVIATFIVARRYFPLPLPIKVFAQCSAVCALMAAVVISVPMPEGSTDFTKLLIKALVGGGVYIPAVLLLNIGNVRNQVRDLYAKRKTTLGPLGH